jgi:hypothetical protein
MTMGTNALLGLWVLAMDHGGPMQLIMPTQTDID